MSGNPSNFSENPHTFVSSERIASIMNFEALDQQIKRRQALYDKEWFEALCKLKNPPKFSHPTTNSILTADAPNRQEWTSL